MTLPMIDSNPPLISRVEERVRCGQGNIRTSYLHLKRLRMRHRETGTSVAASESVSPMPHCCAEEICLVSSPELEPSALPFSSTSTFSRFMDRLGANAPSLSSMRTIPSWRSSLLPDTNKTYAKIHTRSSSEESDTPNPPQLRGAAPRRPALGGLQRRYLRHCRHNKRLTNQHGGHNPFHTPVSNLRTRRHDYSSSSSRSSLSTRPSSSVDSHVPSPSTSEESYPSPYSADALAVFHSSADKHRARFFKSRRKQDRIQVIFEEATDATSTSVSVSSAQSPARRRDRFGRLKRRIRALAESMSPPRSKAPTVFNDERMYPHLDDDDSVEYDIPCLAYISCFR